MTAYTPPIHQSSPKTWRTNDHAVQQKSTDTPQNMLGILLLMSALGPLFNNVAIGRIAMGRSSEFVIDLTHVFLLITALAAAIATKRASHRVILVWLGYMSLEFSHALFFGLTSESEWIKSTAQVGAYSLAFVMISGLTLDRQSLIRMGSFANVMAWLLGGFAIAQFVLVNTIGIGLHLPYEWQSTTYALPFSDARYENVTRAVALSREPSELAFGLATLLAFLVLLNSNGLAKRRATALAISVVLGGILVTLSPTGLLTAIAVLLGTRYVSRSARSSWRLYLLVVIILIILAGSITPLGERLSNILHGTDASTLTRVVASIRLLFDMPDDAELLVLGTGLGLEYRNFETYLSIYQPLVPWELGEDMGMHNILAIVKFQQGLLGLLVYLALLWVILRPPRMPSMPTSRDLTPMLILLLMFFFASGYYASPLHWSLLAFVAVLCRSKWQANQESDSKGHCKLLAPNLETHR